MLNISRLSTVDADFDQKLDALLAWDEVSDESVVSTVNEIVEAVKTKGDEALVEYTNRFDRMSVSDFSKLIVSKQCIEDAFLPSTCGRNSST